MLTNGKVVYHLRWRWRIWAIVCLSLGLGSLGLGSFWLLGVLDVPAARAILFDPGTGKPSIWLAVGYVALLMGWWPCRYGLRLLKVYLVVSTKGLDYHGMSGRVQAPWHEIDCYGPVEWNGPYAAEGVLLHHRPDVGIPLDLFAANWPVSTLGVIILHRAFCLTPRPASAPPRRRNHRAPRPQAPAPAPVPLTRPAITRRLRPLRPSGIAVPGEWQGLVTGRLEEHDGDTVRF